MKISELFVLIMSIIGSLLIIVARYGGGIYNEYKELRIRINRKNREYQFNKKIRRAMK